MMGRLILLPETYLVGAIALAVVLGYVLAAITAPVRIRFKFWIPADVDYEPLDGKYLARDVARTITALRGMGFAVLGHWQSPGNSGATGTITVLEHPQELDVAKLMEVEAGARRSFALLFQTRFEDGAEVATSNNQTTSGLPSPPEITRVWLPEVREPGELYRVHKEVRDSLGAGKRRLAVGADPAAFLKEGTERLLKLWVETGYYYLDETRGVYRPTWKGAIVTTWRHLRPVRPLYRAWRRRRTRKLLDELDIEVEPWD